jgi:3-hydroxyacyl-CoA dehydrogenase
MRKSGRLGLECGIAPFRPRKLLRQYIDEGRFGGKSRRGFYVYPS